MLLPLPKMTNLQPSENKLHEPRPRCGTILPTNEAIVPYLGTVDTGPWITLVGISDKFNIAEPD